MTDTARTLAIRILALASVLAVNVSCTVGPDYVRPSVAVPPAYKEAKDAKAGGPRSEIPRGRWWELFDDGVLNALETEVDVNNQTLRAAAARVRQAQAMTDAAESRYSPMLSVGEPIRTSDSSRAGSSICGAASGAPSKRAPPPPKPPPTTSRQPNFRCRRSSRRDYFLLRVQDAEIRLLQDHVARFERSLQLTRNQYAVGVVSRGDVVQAEAQLMSTRAQALEAEVDEGAVRARHRRADRQGAGRFLDCAHADRR